MTDFDKTYDWKVSFLFISGGHEAAGQCNIIAKTWEEVTEYAKEAPLLVIAEAAEEQKESIEGTPMRRGVLQGEVIDKLEILGIEKINATLVVTHHKGEKTG